nr:hypothetical protein [Tanacetum cinerariifolium]
MKKHGRNIILRSKMEGSLFFFSSIAVQTSGSGISNLLAVATTLTGSENLYCQWEHLTWQWECLVHFIPNKISIRQKFSSNKSFNAYLKTTPPRSGIAWKPTGRIFTPVGLKWIHIRKLVETRYNMNDSASPLGKETHNPKLLYVGTLLL